MLFGRPLTLWFHAQIESKRGRQSTASEYIEGDCDVVDFPEEKKSLLSKNGSDQDEFVQTQEPFDLQDDNSESSQKKSFSFPDVPPHKKADFSFGGEMINQGIETIEFVLGRSAC